MSNNYDERRGDMYRRQIDLIDNKVNEILKILNGNGKIGLAGKVDIMWGYRGIFVGLFSVNLITLISFIVYIYKGG